MKRENRYLVLKRSDIEKYLPGDRKILLDFIARNIRDGRMLDGKEPLQCVIVEHDWPMYEDTWQSIERWVDEKPSYDEMAREYEEEHGHPPPRPRTPANHKPRG